MKLIVWPDLSSQVVPDADVRDLLRAYPKLRVHDLNERWSGKYLACAPERLREATAVTHGRLTDYRAPQRWGQVAREREARDAHTTTPAD